MKREKLPVLLRAAFLSSYIANKNAGNALDGIPKRNAQGDPANANQTQRAHTHHLLPFHVVRDRLHAIHVLFHGGNGLVQCLNSRLHVRNVFFHHSHGLLDLAPPG
ncbi:hypothetical protein DSM25558_1940 [Agrobacterium sp. DSM 25558]|nr:hypothetical protein DSM25558_1940 [Agrobacterium sp. DSM 25558]